MALNANDLVAYITDTVAVNDTTTRATNAPYGEVQKAVKILRSKGYTLSAYKGNRKNPYHQIMLQRKLID